MSVDSKRVLRINNVKATFWIGLAILAMGLVSLWVSFPSTERQGVSVAGLSLAVETRQNTKLAPLLSAVMILAGAGMLIAPTFRK